MSSRLIARHDRHERSCFAQYPIIVQTGHSNNCGAEAVPLADKVHVKGCSLSILDDQGSCSGQGPGVQLLECVIKPDMRDSDSVLHLSDRHHSTPPLPHTRTDSSTASAIAAANEGRHAIQEVVAMNHKPVRF